MKHAVLFDCDGVLVNSEDGLSKIAAFVLNKYYIIPALPEDFAPYIGTGEDTYIGEVVRKYGKTFTQDMKKKIYEEYNVLAQQYVPPMEGSKDLVRKLRGEGFKVALASSADAAKVDINMKILDMEYTDFDAVITGSDVAKKKPDPDIYLIAAKRCGVSPADCIVVEDATSGVLSGKRAGMKVIGITSSVLDKVLISYGADCTVATFKELDEVIHGTE